MYTSNEIEMIYDYKYTNTEIRDRGILVANGF
jgi:hypothetical protein